MMKQELLLVLQWRSPPAVVIPYRSFLKPLSCSSPSLSLSLSLPGDETTPGGSGGGGELLSARERRQLRKERRDSSNWREVVEERLLIKPKKEYKSWTEKLNLDNLARLGTQWWVLRVSRANGHETAEIVAKALVRHFPNLDFKVYFPAVREKRKLKNGTYSVKLKPLFPGCVFLNCVLNKEIHDFIRDCDGIGGFLGSKVGNTKRQINKPKPVPVGEMEVIFRQAKEEQEKFDHAFGKEQQEQSNNSGIDTASNEKAVTGAKPRKHSRTRLELSKSSPVARENYSSLVPGTSVRVLSGPFTEFTGCLKELDHKTGKATVGFMLFGKESFVDLEVGQIVAETT
ncbi:uncharacterized protein M6B38_188960 [Iris pallida]|uniref:NusG-like N-terminal domain-containing protein n=1 Tax=Iris pallida TaxID=29817 RepID=A0AAX6EHS6_IRIPA|nr:uncharacterized protein M6B38_188960 [Iris pallida]